MQRDGKAAANCSRGDNAYLMDRWDPSDWVWRSAGSNEPEQDAAPLASRAGSPGPMPPAMVEALATIIASGLDFIGMIP